HKKNFLNFSICFSPPFSLWTLILLHKIPFSLALSGMSSTGSDSFWTAKQNKDFENALAVFDMDIANRWDNVTKAVSKKIQRKSRSIMSFAHPGLQKEKKKRLECSGSFWTAKQNKDFGNALALFDKDTTNCGIMLPRILVKKPKGSQELCLTRTMLTAWIMLPRKSYYELLVEDIMLIKPGQGPIPDYRKKKKKKKSGWQKNPEEVKKHYELLVEDIMLIEPRQQNKDFENNLVVFHKDTANRWDNVAKAVGE
ncbi:RAD-like 1, partial [Prunus dulcis]